MNIRRTTSKDVNIKGYHIPKGTEVLPQISAVLYDEKVCPKTIDIPIFF
jgi:cytochrome P450